MPRSSLLAFVGIFLLALSAVSLATHGPARAATATVDVGDNWFCSAADTACQQAEDQLPDSNIDVTTSINMGDTVVWNWVGSNPHRVTQCDETFATCSGGFASTSPYMTSGTYPYTFSTAGSFVYQCEVHGSAMRGRVNVVAQSTATPTASSSTSSATPATTGAAPAREPTSGGTPSDGSSIALAALVAAAGALLLIGAAALAFRALDER